MRPRRPRVPLAVQIGLVAVVSFAASLAIAAPDKTLPVVKSVLGHAASLASPVVGSLGIGCTIKGNVSYSGGERIYHMPGQHYYDETKIDWGRGERWFCSENDARAAGWRRAGY